MIVIEGFDGSGKSTLARKAGELLGWPVLHTGGPTKDEADVLSCLVRSISRMRKRCVQDRITHISESVYSALTHPTKAALAIAALKEMALARCVIYCRPPTEYLVVELQRHVTKEWDDSEHFSSVIANAGALIKLYDSIITTVGIFTPVYVYDRTKPGDSERILDIIEGIAR